MKLFRYATIVVLISISGPAEAQNENFQDRQEIIINNAIQYVELSNFKFENRFDGNQTRLVTDLNWKNVSTKVITAFEVVVLRYDPFNRPIPGAGRWLITGHNSVDWRPLAPGQSSGDGVLDFEVEPVFTAVAFVAAIRFQNGDVWNADLSAVEKDLRQKLPVLKDLGNLKPAISRSKQ